MPFSKDPLVLRTIILDNYQNPRNKIDLPAKMPEYNHVHNKSMSCIDDFHVYLRISQGKVADAKYAGVGCAISTAAASIVTSLLVGRDVADARQVIAEYKKMIAGVPYDEELLSEANAFFTIHKQPGRVKCALSVPEPLGLMLDSQLK